MADTEILIGPNDNFQAFFALLLREIKQELVGKIAETLQHLLEQVRLDYCQAKTVPAAITSLGYENSMLQNLFLGKLDSFKSSSTAQPDAQLLTLATLLGRALLASKSDKTDNKDFTFKLPNALVFRSLADAFNFVLNEEPNNYSFTHAETERFFQILIDSKTGKCQPVEAKMMGSEVIQVTKFRMKTPPTGLKVVGGQSVLLTSSQNYNNVLLSQDQGDTNSVHLKDVYHQDAQNSLQRKFDAIVRAFDKDLDSKETEIHELARNVFEAYYSHEDAFKIKQMKQQLTDLNLAHMKLVENKRSALLNVKYGELASKAAGSLQFEIVDNFKKRVRNVTSKIYDGDRIDREDEAREAEPHSNSSNKQSKPRFKYSEPNPEHPVELVHAKKYDAKYQIVDKKSVQ